MNLLALVTEFTGRTGIAQPTLATGSTDKQVIQILGLINEVCEDLANRWNWEELVNEAVFTTLALEDQGAIGTIAASGYKFILQNTIYDRTLRLPLYGPMTPQDWQALKALPNAGPFNKYRIVRNRLLLNPIPAAGHTCAFEYASSYGIVAVDGVTYRKYPTVDTDNFRLPDENVLAGLRWKWKFEKGLPYAEDFRRYEEMANNSKGREGSKPTISMSDSFATARPGIFVPSGNWSLP